MLVKSDLPIESSQSSSLEGNVSSSSSLSSSLAHSNHPTFVVRTTGSVLSSDQIGSETTSTNSNSPAQNLHNNNNNNNNHSTPTHDQNNPIEDQIKSLACSQHQSHDHHQQQQLSETFTVEVNPPVDNIVDGCDCVSIIHFNDCYNIEPSPQSSGAAGFLTAINHLRHLNPMILFSGDILSPSFMSTFTKGEQMIPVLNDIRVDCAVFGNHEFDYGVDNLIEFVKRTTFPWLLSNVIDKETSNQLGDGQIYHIIERCGFKFGLIGLIEEEWLSTLSTLDSSDVIYQDFVERGQELARWLKSELKVDYVIALTHFRTPNDIRLADSVPEIDLVLGGHDHDYEIIKRPNCHIIKSGTDFREFSKITLKINPNYERSIKPSSNSSCINVDIQVKPFLEPDIEHIKCVGYEQDEELKNKLNKFVTTIDEKMGKVLGQFNCPLDGRFSSIRKYETNLGNFVTDIMLASTHADLAILNSGTLRSDRIHPRGDFTMRDLYNILGYIDPIAVLLASGEDIWRALENGVSQWPKLEGRFPQISGCAFAFDPSKPAGSRIKPSDISIGDEPLDLRKHYKLTTKAYLASGKDGYDVLKDCKTLVPGDESPDLTTSILNHFEAISIVKSNRRTHHRQSIICLSRASLQKILESQNSTCSAPDDMESTFASTSSSSLLKAPQKLDTSHSPLLPMVNKVSESLIGKCLPEEADNDGNNNDVSMERPTSSMDASGTQLSPAGAAAAADANGISGRQVERVQDGALMPSSSPIVGMEVPSPSAIKSMAGESASSTPISMVAKPRTNRLMSLYEMEHEQCKLEPKIEGRIRIVGLDEAQYPRVC